MNTVSEHLFTSPCYYKSVSIGGRERDMENKADVAKLSEEAEHGDAIFGDAIFSSYSDPLIIGVLKCSRSKIMLRVYN